MFANTHIQTHIQTHTHFLAFQTEVHIWDLLYNLRLEYAWKYSTHNNPQQNPQAHLIEENEGFT